MLGDKSLVTQVIEKAVRERKVILPKGIWKEIDKDIERIILKTTEVSVEANLNKIIIFEKM